MQTVDEYISHLAVPQRVVAERLQELIDEALPQAVVRIWHGHPVWMAEEAPVAGLKAYPRYVSLLLWGGKHMSDASGRLQPSAGSTDLASVKVATVGEIDDGLFRDWLAQAAAFS